MDKKITQLPELVTPGSGDLIPIVPAPTEIPQTIQTMYITPANLQAALSTRMANLEAGWIALPNGTRVSDTSFTLPGNYSGILKNFAKWKGFLSNQKYGYVLSSSYSAGTGLTTVNLVPNADYSLSVGGTVTGMFVSFGNPPDFPAWFNYTPNGISASNVSLSGRFNIVGRTCYFQFLASFTGSITFTAMPSLPVISSSNIITTRYGHAGWAGYLDAGTAEYPNGLWVEIHQNVDRFLLQVANSVTLLSATSPITWANGDVIEAAGFYEI
jgi:hypothetical protein